MKPPSVYTCVSFIFSADSAEAPAFAKATAGPTIALIPGRMSMIFCEGGEVTAY